jgi:small subunit ribosomal protein S7
MERGKKQTAQGVVYKAFAIVKSKGLDEIQTLETAVANVGPKMEVRARRVGGASYQVPTEVRGDRRVSLALRWITGFARKRSNKEFKTYAEKLAAELVDAANNTGEAIKKRDTVLRNAEANRAFAHFKW